MLKKALSRYFQILAFSFLYLKEKRNLIQYEDISEIKAEVVQQDTPLHPELCFDQLVYRQLLQHLILHLY